MGKKEIKQKPKIKENKINYLKKESVDINSKIKKKFKATKKLLKIDNEKIINTLKAIKLENFKKNEQEGLYENIYLYIFITNSTTNDKLNELKSKMLKYPNLTINQTNMHKICLVDDNLLNQKEKDTQKVKDSNDQNDDKVIDKILEKLTLDPEIEENLEIITEKEFIAQIKSKEVPIERIYHNYIVSDTLRTKLNQILKSLDNKTLGFNILYYNKNKYGKNIFEYLKRLIGMANSSGILNIISKKNVGIIKVGNTSMDIKDLYANTKLLSYKIVSLMLNSSEKHSSVRCILLKSNDSLPYEIEKTMQPDDLDIF